MACRGSRATATGSDANDPIGWIELDPAGAGQVHLTPGVGRAAARMALRLEEIGLAPQGYYGRFVAV
jgi:hypothetical protein